MAIEYSKINLGKLFGGYIASINYSLGVGNESNRCTLTIISEDNTFENPKFNEVISVPPFSISMKVVEFTIRDEINKKVLQVELIDQVSEILDKQLVLVYGIHTDPFLSMDNDKYFETKSIYIDRSQWSTAYRFNPRIKLADHLAQGLSKNFGDGKNVIGTSRISRSRKAIGYMDSLNTAVKTQPAQVAVYEGGFIKKSLSSFYEKDFEEWDVTKDGESNIQFGYTLFDLKKLFEKYGLSFSNLDFQKLQNNKVGNKGVKANKTQGSSAIMFDTALFFSDSGTFRETLASCLNKIGRTFYIDPFSQKINIISNADISKINSNLNSKYSDGINIEGATQKSITKSIADVQAIHIILKGIVDENINEFNTGSISTSSEGKKYYETFYRLLEDDFGKIASVKRDDKTLVKKALSYLDELNENENLLNTYIIALRESFSFLNPSFYGDQNCEFRNSNSGASRFYWEQHFKTEQERKNTSTIGGFFDFREKSEGFNLFREDPNDFTSARRIKALLPSETLCLQKMNAYAKIVYGLYFSAPDSLEDLQNKSYETQTAQSENSLESIDVNIVNLNSKISEVDFLSFLEPFFKPDLESKTVRDLAKESWPENLISANSDENDHVAIAIRKPILKKLESIKDDVFKKTICTSIGEKDDNLYYIRHRDAEETIDQIAETSEDIVSNYSLLKFLRVKYTKQTGSNSSANIEQSSDLLDFEEKSISTINSNSTNFSSRSIKVIENNKFQMDVLKANIQDIIPEYTGPFIKVSVDYFRPPKIEDLNPEEGVNSLSVSMSSDGIRTSVNYSSIRYTEIDFNLLSETYGFKDGLIIDKPEVLPAFKRK